MEYFTKSIISAVDLKNIVGNKNLIILDCSVNKVGALVSNELLPKVQIKGARFLDLENEFSDTSSDLPHTLPSAESFTKAAQKLCINKDSILVVYDNLGIYSSPRVWWMFKTMGHKNIAVLDGGLAAWQKIGGDCEIQEIKSYPLGNFIAKLNQHDVKNSQDILVAIEQKNKLLLDARSEARFKALAPEPRPGLKGGHIPTGCSLPFDDVLKDGYYLEKEELKKIFNKFETQNKEIIFSCGSGLTACIILLAAEIIGLKNLSVYDGSWAEWGKEGPLPIEK